MGRLVKITLWSGDEKKCHACGMEHMKKDPKSCCTNKHEQLKSEKGDSLTFNQIKLSANAYSVIQPIWVTKSFYIPICIKRPVSQAPPPGIVVPVFLRNCTFLI